MEDILMIGQVIVSETPGVAESLAKLDYRARELVAYVDANGGWTINYGAPHVSCKPISIATAESAVNQVLNQRCASGNKCGRRHGVHLVASSDVPRSTVSSSSDSQGTRSRRNHCPAKLHSSLSNSGLPRSYNPKLFNAPQVIFDLLFRAGNSRNQHLG